MPISSQGTNLSPNISHDLGLQQRQGLKFIFTRCNTKRNHDLHIVFLGNDAEPFGPRMDARLFGDAGEVARRLRAAGVDGAADRAGGGREGDGRAEALVVRP